MTAASSAPLAGLRILEHSTSLAGAYAGRLLRDVGAHVLRVGGSSSLGRGPELDAFLHDGKAARDGDVAQLAAVARDLQADAVVLELPDAPEDGLLDAFGDAVVAVITPWGLDGPWAGSGRPWSELTLQAESGALAMRGVASSYPLMSASSESFWVAGAMTAGGIAATLQGGRAGRLLDVSLLEVTAYSNNLFQDIAATVTKAGRQPFSHRVRLSPSVEPAKDGWVGFNLASAQNHEDFLVLIGRADWLEDDLMKTFLGRYLNPDEFSAAVRAYTRQHTVDELVETASAFRIPCSPVHDGRTVLEDPQVVARDFYVEQAAGGKVPRPTLLLDGVRPERTSEPAPLEDRPAPGRLDDDRLPFAGLRVIDLGTWWVGAYVGSALGSFGADVVKVESTRRIDGARTLGGVPQTQDHWWECGNFYIGANFNKRNVTLDLTQPEGRALLVRLIETADVLIENYAPRVLESVGLDWDAVHAINPRLVLMRMPAFGLTGPRRDMVGFAQTVEQFSGLCARTGYPDGDPTNPNGPADPMGAANCFFAIASALRHARATGEGVLVEAPLVEGALTMASEQVLRWTARGELLTPQGNRSEHAWLQGVFVSEEADAWIGLSVLDDAQWASFCEVAGLQHWPAEVPTREAAQARAEELEKEVAAWVAGQSADDVVRRLLEAGVPAGRMTDARFVREHEHLGARGTYEPVDLPYAGTVAHPTLPFRRVGGPGWLTRRTPLLGEHNDEVLRGELGLSDAELEALAAKGVIGTAPAGSA